VKPWEKRDTGTEFLRREDMRNAVLLASLTCLAGIESARAVVLFQDDFEAAPATPFTLAQQLANPALKTDNDPLNTVGGASSDTPGTWFHYHKSSTAIENIQVTTNPDTPPFGPPVTGTYQGSNVLRLNRSKEPPSSNTAIGAVFQNQTSGVVRAKWKMMAPHQQFGVEFGITFPAMWTFTPFADNDHQNGINGGQTPTVFINGLNSQGDFEQYLRSSVGMYPFDLPNGGTISFKGATDPKVEVNKWQDYTLEADIDAQTYTMNVDGNTTAPIPFNFPGGFDTLTFRVAQAAAPGDPNMTAMYFIDDVLIETVGSTPTGADANADGIVDTQDFNILAGNFGMAGQTFAQGDFSGDGLVDSVDFGILLENYGESTSPGPLSIGSVVPEPASLTGVLGAMVLLRRKRRA